MPSAPCTFRLEIVPLIRLQDYRTGLTGNFCLYWSFLEIIRKNKDLRRVNRTCQELDIRDHACLKAYRFDGQDCLEFCSGPMEIYLFCVAAGNASLDASFIPHILELGSSEAIFLAFPREEWTAKAYVAPGTILYTLKMEVSTLHKLINPTFNDHQLDPAQRINMRDLMKMIPVNPSLMICFDQLLHHKLKPPFHEIFERAKFLEIFSLLMESAFGQRMESCPVSLSHAIESKLQQVRRHIITHLDETPDSDQLAVMYELPRNTLKEGYKFVYGKSIHQYHADHKFESALQMLNQGELLVKEVAFKIGYQNPSHFISAFKKKFGYTPKQYLKREVLT